MGVCTSMFNENPEEFVDLCFALGVYVGETEIEKLYNEVSWKINDNPDFFFNILKHRDLENLTLLKKGLQYEDGDTTIININDDGTIYFDGELIGRNEDEAVAWIAASPKKRDVLMRKLGITPEIETKVKNVVSSKDIPADHHAKLRVDATINTARLNNGKNNILKAVKAWGKAVKADPENQGAITKQLYDKVDEIRNDYSDVGEALEVYFHEQCENFKIGAPM
jgi:hypothetical protein